VRTAAGLAERIAGLGLAQAVRTVALGLVEHIAGQVLAEHTAGQERTVELEPVGRIAELLVLVERMAERPVVVAHRHHRTNLVAVGVGRMTAAELAEHIAGLELAQVGHTAEQGLAGHTAELAERTVELEPVGRIAGLGPARVVRTVELVLAERTAAPAVVRIVVALVEHTAVVLAERIVEQELVGHTAGVLAEHTVVVLAERTVEQELVGHTAVVLAERIAELEQVERIAELVGRMQLAEEQVQPDEHMNRSRTVRFGRQACQLERLELQHHHQQDELVQQQQQRHQQRLGLGQALALAMEMGLVLVRTRYRFEVWAESTRLSTGSL
jgi:hypothetical protein